MSFDLADIEAAVEMANEELGHDAIVKILSSGQVRPVYDNRIGKAFEVSTKDGVITVGRDAGAGWEIRR